uniref:Uncharacterized protein n=1 Tax=Brassica oleracea TaxID=3712 RepID=A0A3P6DRT0_BRAOL|nr:unnamed protein product [Brassica oleracea]
MSGTLGHLHRACLGPKGQSGSSRRRRGITLLGDENEEGTVVSAQGN